MTVKVIQYIRPNGRQVQQETDINDNCRDNYERMIVKDWNLACEVLSTGYVSVTIEDRKNKEDIDISIVPNGPEVQIALEKMLAKI